MSQSSETTTPSDFQHLGYPDSSEGNGYYTAQPRPGIGVCIAALQGGTMVQFFPWEELEAQAAALTRGHERYAAFITSKATAARAEKGELFTRWPFIYAENADILIVKCMVEEGLNQVEQMNDPNQHSAADPTTGEAMG